MSVLYYLLTMTSFHYHTYISFESFLLITDLNKRPHIGNLPGTVTLLENAAVGTVIAYLDISDDAIMTGVTNPCTAFPYMENSKFEYNVSSECLMLEDSSYLATTLAGHVFSGSEM